MSRFNTNTTHPIIPNSQQYMFEQEYISIHSQDINKLKYPNSSEFEIELPQDYLNVQGFRLASGEFPMSMNTFSEARKNITMSFKISDVYNPVEAGVVDPLAINIFATLYEYLDEYVFSIEQGNYDATQMATELTNKFNKAVTDVILGPGSMLSDSQKADYIAAGGYQEFTIVHNKVSNKLWFGNKSSGFELTNTTTATMEENDHNCAQNLNAVPDFSNWGLPAYLGFSRCNCFSNEMTDSSVTRFYYGDVVSGDNGYWLNANQTPQYSGAKAYYIEAPLPVNLKHPAYFYMEIKFLNFMDETAPYNYSTCTEGTNLTNGIVNASFAKIPFNNCGCNYYEAFNLANNYKIYNPPVERIRKLSIKFRYHDGTLVEFLNANYTFTLELTLFRPQNQKNYHMYTPESIANNW